MDTGKFLRTVLAAARDLARPGIFFHALWPPLTAFALWMGIAWLVWQPATAWVQAQLPAWEWLSWAGPWLAQGGVILALVPLAYFTALLLVAVFALPRMMTLIAHRDYPDVSRQGSATAAFWGSLGNTVAVGAVFIVGWLITLPLLLIPGMILILPLFWAAWLNQRAFRFDALAEHAQSGERLAIIQRERGSLMLGGLVGALVSYVPLLNLLAPAFTAVLFVHLCLGALRELRQEKGVSL